MSADPAILPLGEIEVLKPGSFTTVQDLGRSGSQKMGVPAGGAMDRFAVRLANLLVGNEEGAAALEVTFTGPTLYFRQDARLAIGGARYTGVPSLQPFTVKAGETLTLTAAESGARGYVAIGGGGVHVPQVLGSASTFTRAALGGVEGRVLRAGDLLTFYPRAAVESVADVHWHVSSTLLPPYSSRPVVRVVQGPQWSWFCEQEWNEFLSAEFEVLAKSDRMGLRLSGPGRSGKTRPELISEAVAFGSIQIPPDGQPIVLMADRQTIGGYPKIANVISVDLPLLAQVRPGDRVRFSAITLSEAQSLYLAEEHAIAKLREGLVEKLRK